jgi:hypothetical protein
MDIKVVLGLIIGLQLILALLLSCVSDKCLPPLSHYLKQRRDDDTMIYFNVIAIGTLLWTGLWCMVVGFDLIRQCPWILVGLLWPIALGFFQLHDVYYDRCEDAQDHQQQRTHLIGGIHLDSSTVISFAFASATLFWAIGNIGDKRNLIPAARIIMFALLICIGLVVPTHHFVDNNQRYATYVRVAQRISINYAMGLLMTALVVVLTNCVGTTTTTPPTTSNMD